jgi:2-polyprenyl-6-methoxyphenol hydroxylase-like FAD-dependent oxidoreductase
MDVVCVGGGPAGLYFAILARKAKVAAHITVLERNHAGAGSGWGVTYTEGLLEELYFFDRKSAQAIRDASVVWQERLVRLPKRSAYFPGYGYSIARPVLLDILAGRAESLGVEVRHGSPVEDPAEVSADLVVAADGANSRMRQRYAQKFDTRVEYGANRYIWLGTEAQFVNLVFALEPTAAGPIWMHGYPSVAGIGTCVVECSPATCQGLGLDENANAVSALEHVFAKALGGRRLLTGLHGETARWQCFGHVSNRTWYHDNLVLIGDAAHTTHFSIGAGTAQAMLDAATLVRSLRAHPELSQALQRFDEARRPALDRLQHEAKDSMRFYENLHRLTHLDVYGLANGLSGAPESQLRARLRDRVGQVPTVRRLRRRSYALDRWACTRRREKAGRKASATVG